MANEGGVCQMVSWSRVIAAVSCHMSHVQSHVTCHMSRIVPESRSPSKPLELSKHLEVSKPLEVSLPRARLLSGQVSLKSSRGRMSRSHPPGPASYVATHLQAGEGAGGSRCPNSRSGPPPARCRAVNVLRAQDFWLANCAQKSVNYSKSSFQLVFQISQTK